MELNRRHQCPPTDRDIEVVHFRGLIEYVEQMAHGGVILSMVIHSRDGRWRDTEVRC